MSAAVPMILIATESGVVSMDVEHGTTALARGLTDRPTCLAAEPRPSGRAWCGTQRGGVFRTDDAGVSWRPCGLEGERIMSITASPAETDVVWIGTEPSTVWRSADGGETWDETSRLDVLPSSSTWAFPPKPETHHVRWIACHPQQAGKLWVAIEAGALVSTTDGGRTWRDRAPGGPYDTHELAIHPDAPDSLRVAAGDGYYESDDGGTTWRSPRSGLDVGYLRSVAIDPGRPDVVIVSASSGPRSAYGAGVSDGRLYRRAGRGHWERVREGWPETPSTIAPLLLPGAEAGELWAADERGLHHSGESGIAWRNVASYPKAPRYLRALALLR
jgi:ligand-binding sensor domain-containing protein